VYSYTDRRHVRATEDEVDSIAKRKDFALQGPREGPVADYYRACSETRNYDRGEKRDSARSGHSADMKGISKGTRDYRFVRSGVDKSPDGLVVYEYRSVESGVRGTFSGRCW
jgi:hypothetical protein